MANSWFQFKQFKIHQDRCAMKVTTDGCLFGAWVAGQLAVGSLAVGSRQLTVLDLGTGTGLLSLMVAQKYKAQIDAVEIEAEAAGQAKENMEASPWKDRLYVIQADAKNIAHHVNRKYDTIISNPPFYENELQSGNTHKNTAHHSTELSLEDLINIIGSDILRPEGNFYLLLPYKRDEEIEKIIAASDLSITQKVLVKQSTKHDFFRIMLSGIRGKSKERITTTEISIKDNNDQYTAEFTELLKDYYLYLT